MIVRTVVKDDENGGASSMNGGEWECKQGIDGKVKRKETTRKPKTCVNR
jgi:hypothetical protein